MTQPITRGLAGRGVIDGASAAHAWAESVTSKRSNPWLGGAGNTRRRPPREIVRSPLWPGLLFALLVLSGLVDLPSNIAVGPISALGALSIIYCVAAWALWAAQSVRGPLIPVAALPLVLLAAWAALSLLSLAEPTMAGMQNVLVLGGFVGTILLGFRVGQSRYPLAERVSTVLGTSVGIAAAFYAGELLLEGIAPSSPMGSRSFALFALFGVASSLAAARYSRKFGVVAAGLLFTLIGLSLSRMAMGASLALIPLSQLPRRGWTGWLRPAVLTVLISASALAAVTTIQPLRDRFLSGDVSLQVGDVAINAEGRTTFWDLTLASWASSPWLGHGAGSVETVLSAALSAQGQSGITHPHDDYLRILHDYGILGLLLWLLGFVALLRGVWKAWSEADGEGRDDAAAHLTTFLAMLGLAASMLTDNTIVYTFLMFPLGIAVGTSLGAAQRWRRNPPVRRSVTSGTPSAAPAGGPTQPAAPGVERRSSRYGRSTRNWNWN